MLVTHGFAKNEEKRTREKYPAKGRFASEVILWRESLDGLIQLGRRWSIRLRGADNEDEETGQHIENTFFLIFQYRSQVFCKDSTSENRPVTLTLSIIKVAAG